MPLQALMENGQFVLGEGSLYERLRRSPAVELDDHVAHAGLIYNDGARDVLEAVHREYLEIGVRYKIPMMASSPTWRANRERIDRSPFAGMPVNRDAVRFMRDLAASLSSDGLPILIAGQCGPKGDGYLPEEAPSADDAVSFHAEQIDGLAEGGADILIAQTLPAFPEAFGLARAMAASGLPYIVSFVVRPDGTLLDGTAMDEAIDRIDNDSSRPPETYNANCVHASVFASAVTAIGQRNTSAAARITGLHANTSPKSPEELEGLEVLETEEADDFAENLNALRENLNIGFLGGCCGTSTEHMEALAARVKQ